MKFFVADFAAPTGASVLIFCVHLQVGKVYCVNENEGANSHFVFFSIFHFSFCLSYIIHMDIFPSKISKQLLELGF